MQFPPSSDISWWIIAKAKANKGKVQSLKLAQDTLFTGIYMYSIFYIFTDLFATFGGIMSVLQRRLNYPQLEEYWEHAPSKLPGHAFLFPGRNLYETLFFVFVANGLYSSGPNTSKLVVKKGR